MLRRSLLMVLAIVIVLSFAACGGKEEAGMTEQTAGTADTMKAATTDTMRAAADTTAAPAAGQ